MPSSAHLPHEKRTRIVTSPSGIQEGSRTLLSSHAFLKCTSLMRTHSYRNLPYNMNPNEGYIHCSNNAVENMLRTHWEHIGNKEKTPPQKPQKKPLIFFFKFLKRKKKTPPTTNPKGKKPKCMLRPLIGCMKLFFFFFFFQNSWSPFSWP